MNYAEEKANLVREIKKMIPAYPIQFHYKKNKKESNKRLFRYPHELDNPWLRKAELQSYLTQLRNNTAVTPQVSEGSGGEQKPVKGKTKKPSKNEGKDNNSIGNGKNNGSYQAVEFTNPTEFALAKKYLEKYTRREQEKITNYRGIVPGYLQYPVEIFPKKNKTIEDVPYIFLRSRNTSYMTKKMEALCSSFKVIAEKEKIPLFLFTNLRGNFTHDNKTIRIQELEKVKKKTILIITCGCAGGGYDELFWGKIRKLHNIVVLTHYAKGDNCGCSTLRSWDSLKIEIVYNCETATRI